MALLDPLRFLDLSDPARRIACRRIEGSAPGVLWLGGFGSDMSGGKAEHLAMAAAVRGFGFCRFDYSGHGASDGNFADGTISTWTRDAQGVLDTLPPGPTVLAGSSMGAWIALRLALAAAPRRIAGLLLLAPAPDFTGRLVEPHLTAQDRAALDRDGFVSLASRYGPGRTVYTAALIADGQAAAVMNGPIETRCPVRIIQGIEDPDVPFTHALALAALLPADEVTVTLVPGGDHRLSRPEDLERMEAGVLDLLSDAGRF